MWTRFLVWFVFTVLYFFPCQSLSQRRHSTRFATRESPMHKLHGRMGCLGSFFLKTHSPKRSLPGTASSVHAQAQLTILSAIRQHHGRLLLGFFFIVLFCSFFGGGGIILLLFSPYVLLGRVCTGWMGRDRWAAGGYGNSTLSTLHTRQSSSGS